MVGECETNFSAARKLVSPPGGGKNLPKVYSHASYLNGLASGGWFAELEPREDKELAGIPYFVYFVWKRSFRVMIVLVI